MGQCLFCLRPTKPSGSKYCSNRRQADYQHKEYIRKWKVGLVSGDRGTKAPLLSAHIRKISAGKVEREMLSLRLESEAPYYGQDSTRSEPY